jgi:hypothetical protein
MNVSGKLTIVAILALALAAAAASWWFRYNATHRAATFWGPASRLIRDAKVVEFYQFKPSGRAETEIEELLRFFDTRFDARDVSSLPGLTHLRNALLEDSSYIWPPLPRTPKDPWRWVLVFRDEPGVSAAVLAFSPDWRLVTNCKDPLGKNVSCEPIAAGLGKMLGELSSHPSTPVQIAPPAF